MIEHCTAALLFPVTLGSYQALIPIKYETSKKRNPGVFPDNFRKIHKFVMYNYGIKKFRYARRKNSSL